MTREEAIAHARNVRNKSKNASMICLDAEVIDALLASPWHDFSEGDSPDNSGWYFVKLRRGNKVVHGKAYFISYDWCCPDGDEDAEVIWWMEIPELSEED